MRTAWNKGKREGQWLKCKVCGKKIYRYPSEKTTRNRFCSFKCYWSSTEFRQRCAETMRKTNLKRGHKPYLYDNGYKMIYMPEHPDAKKTEPKGYIYEHRLVMEKHLGRPLTKKEKVHHKNKNILDNRIENLELCESSGHHTTKYHIHRDLLGRFDRNQK